MELGFPETGGILTAVSYYLPIHHVNQNEKIKKKQWKRNTMYILQRSLYRSGVHVAWRYEEGEKEENETNNFEENKMRNRNLIARPYVREHEHAEDWKCSCSPSRR